ncbi:MAG: hypothetical protein AB1801_01010 [Chloroflexota bacterium]
MGVYIIGEATLEELAVAQDTSAIDWLRPGDPAIRRQMQRDLLGADAATADWDQTAGLARTLRAVKQRPQEAGYLHNARIMVG